MEGPLRACNQIPEKSSIRQLVWIPRPLAAQNDSVCRRKAAFVREDALGLRLPETSKIGDEGHLPLNHSLNFAGSHAGIHKALAFRSLKLVIKVETLALGHNSSRSCSSVGDCFIVNNRWVPHSSPVLA